MAADQRILVTVILHHDQSKTLDEIMAHVKETGFYRDFPPQGTELVSWVVAMSYGFIIHKILPDSHWTISSIVCSIECCLICSIEKIISII